MPSPTPRALQAWLEHKNIQHTERHTELAPDRFDNVCDENFLVEGRRLEPARYGQIRTRAIMRQALCHPPIAVMPDWIGLRKDAPPKRGLKAMHGERGAFPRA